MMAHNAFLLALDSAEDPLTANLSLGRQHLTRLCNTLRHCQDPLPDLYRAMLDLPAGATYGDAVRLIEEEPDIWPQCIDQLE